MEPLPWSGRVTRFDVTDSTNARALEAIASGEGRHGDAFVAARQSAGRGTRGRRWESGEGGLYVSLILEAPAEPPAGLWTVAGALAVHDVCAGVGVGAALDWPNDVVAWPGGGKIAGVLAEGRGGTSERRPAHALGIGVNVLASAAPAEHDLGRPVASLEGLGADAAPAEVEALLLAALERRAGEAARDAAALFDAFYRRCWLRGSDVRLVTAAGAVAGRFVALDPVRGVGLEGPGGRLAWAPVGHVAALRADPATAGGSGDASE